MFMKAMKLAAAGLVVLIGGLSLIIYRMRDRALEQPAPAAVAQVAPVAAPAAPQAAPEPAVTPAPERAKPSPIPAKKSARKPAAPATPAAVASNQPPASTAAAEKPAAPAKPPAPGEPVRPRSAPEPPKPRTATIPAGAVLVVRTQNTLSTERSFAGDTFTATLAEPLEADGFVIAEKGAEVEGRVVRSQKAGRVEGVSSLAVELVRLQTADGQKLSIATGLHEVRGERSRGSDAKKVGVATGVGAIIGAIAGGGKGAAIGAGVGAGAGAGTVLATRGEHAQIPSETVLRFQLRAPVTVTESR